MSRLVHPLAALRVLAAVALVCSGIAHADPVQLAEALSADPDTATFAVSVRDHMGASVGAQVPVSGDDAPGWSVRVPMLVELHNRIGNLAPNNYWRGLIGIDVHLRTGDAARPVRWTVKLTHESDHATWGTAVAGLPNEAGFYELNSLGFAVAAPVTIGHQALVASADARLHLVSCNLGVALCGSGALGWGSLGMETRAQLVWLGGAQAKPGHWTPTAGLFLDWLAPHDLIRTERRLLVHLGAFLQTERRGVFDVFVLGWWGNDVGLARQERIAQTGIGIRWSPP